MSVVFRETYHDGADARTPERLQQRLPHLHLRHGRGRQMTAGGSVKPGVDPLAAIPPLAQPFVEQALDAAPPPHQPGTYPFIPDRWTPDKVYSGGYKAWALTPDELILYMPDYPVAMTLRWTTRRASCSGRWTAAPCRRIFRSPRWLRSCARVRRGPVAR